MFSSYIGYYVHGYKLNPYVACFLKAIKVLLTTRFLFRRLRRCNFGKNILIYRCQTQPEFYADRVPAFFSILLPLRF